MKNLKKTVAVLLTLLTVFGTFSIGFYAFAVPENNNVTDSAFETEIKGTNTLGKLLSKEFDMSKAGDADSNRIIGAEYTDEGVNVSFVTDTYGVVAVAAFTEGTQQLLDCNYADVTPEDQSVTVEFNEALPQYFIIKAYLLDCDFASLCKEYICNQKTKDYEDFENLTVNDFDCDKVINLDEKEETNFVVMNDGTYTVDFDGVHNVLDSENNDTYTFTNIDSEILSLKAGDIFYYDNDSENFVIVKIESITISGDTAVIVADNDIDYEEAFEVVKISSETDRDNTFEICEDDELEDGIVYEGRTYYNAPAKAKGLQKSVQIDPSATFTDSYSFKDKTFEPKEPKKIGKSGNFAITGSFKISGSVDFTGTAKFKFYYSKKFKEVSIVITPKINFNITVEGKGRIEFSLKALDFSPVTGVYIGIKPKIVLEGSIDFTIDRSWSFDIGVGWDSANGLVNKCASEPDKQSIDLEGEIFLGIDLCPRVYALSEKFAKIELNGEVGAKVTASLNLKGENNPNHSCIKCLDGKISFVGSLSGSIALGEKTKYEKKISVKFLNIEIEISKFYWSYTYDQHGWGKCPFNKTFIQYGSYPQTEVKDKDLIAKLEAASGTWKSYDYMSGDGTSWDDGLAQPSDYMQYKDVTVDGNRYRAVKFSTYRPYYTNYASTTSASYTYQDDNGYYINTTYWFKFEPLDWRVLDPQLGLVMCEDIIDSQPYSNTIYYLNSNYWKDSAGTIYANNYAESSIRAWLNDDFYYTAFSSSEQGNITTATIDNKAFSSSYSQYDSATTSDKVFMLTYDDALNTDYGFNASYSNYDINRRAAGSDYAKCQGLYVYNGTSYNTADGRKTSSWWLRSAGYYSSHATSVHFDGYASDGSFCCVYDTYIGVRPALILNPQSSVNLSTGKKSAPAKNISSKPSDVSPVTASQNNGTPEKLYTLLSLKKDEEISSSAILAIGQTAADENGKVEISFVPKSDAESDVYLIGEFDGEIKTLKVEPKAHEHNFIPETTDPTCTTEGYTTYTCECGESYVDDYVDPLTHTMGKAVYNWSDDLTMCKAEKFCENDCGYCVTETAKTTVSKTSATCENEGVITYTAAFNNKTFYTQIKTETTPAINHKNAYLVREVSATCDKEGYTVGRYCPDCDKFIEGHETISATGHHHQVQKVVAPTCTTEGYTVYTCECGDSYIANQKKPTGHNNVNGKCANCGYDFTNDCSCKCHSSGFALFIWKIGNFFHRIFGMKQYKECGCGKSHW